VGLQPSASRTDLLLQCQRPFDPATYIEYVEAGEPARYGSAFHWMLAGLFLGMKGEDYGAEAALARYNMTGRSNPDTLTEHVFEAKAIMDRWLKGDNAWGSRFKIESVEGPLRFNFSPVRVEQTTLDEATHEYDMAGWEMAGTPDLVAVSGKLRAVIDHKTGRGHYARPSHMGQLRTLAIATRANIAAVLDAPAGSLAMVHAEPVTPAVRLAHRKALQVALDRVGDGTLRPGPECKWCPARFDCPAKSADIIEAATRLLPAATLAVAGKPGTVATLTADDAGKIHQMASEFDRLAKAAKEEIRGMVMAGEEIVRPDGKRLAIVTKNVERISKKSILKLPGGAAELERLRSIGALETTEQEELRAI